MPPPRAAASRQHLHRSSGQDPEPPAVSQNDSTPDGCSGKYRRPPNRRGITPPSTERHREWNLSGTLKGDGCGSFETTPGIENPRVEAGLSDTLWSLRTVPITPLRSETQQSTPPRGFEKLRGQVDRTGGDCLGWPRPTGKYRVKAAGRKFSRNQPLWTESP